MPAAPPGAGRRVGFFPGSTIGNFTPHEALHFLQLAAQVLRGGALLLGVDLVKDPAMLHAAYNDAQGVTAAFNLNLLARANRELGASFALEQFAHSAFYNAPLQRIEMHLVSRCRQQVEVDGQSFELDEGDTLHTENSHKFTIDGLRTLALRAGFRPGPVWTDDRRPVQRALAACAGAMRTTARGPNEGDLERHGDRAKRRHRGDGRQPLFSAELAQARVRHFQQPPHQQSLEGRGELLLAAGQR